MDVRKNGEIVLVVCASFVMAYLLEIVTLGCVQLRCICRVCDQETSLRNMWSHFRWHLRRGEWE